MQHEAMSSNRQEPKGYYVNVPSAQALQELYICLPEFTIAADTTVGSNVFC